MLIVVKPVKLILEVQPQPSTAKANAVYALCVLPQQLPMFQDAITAKMAFKLALTLVTKANKFVPLALTHARFSG